MKFKKIIATMVASICVLSMCVACSKDNAANDTTDKNGTTINGTDDTTNKNDLTDSMDELKDDIKDTTDNVKDDITGTSDGFGMDNGNPNSSGTNN